MLEIGIVIDLHHHNAAIGLLEVDAVKSLADGPCRTHGDIDHLGRGLIEIEGSESALAGRAVGPVLDDLPMSSRHPILANEERLAREVLAEAFDWAASLGATTAHLQVGETNAAALQLYKVR